MLLKDISLDSPEDNVLLDEALLVLAEKHMGAEVIRFWESPKVFIVLGRIGQLDAEVHLEAVKKDGISVLRRTSGGGTVVQGPGCLNFALVLDKKREPSIGDLRRSYAWISAKVTDVLQRQGVHAVFRPISDIAVSDGEKKFSGNAQRRSKNYILHHGTILYDFDLTLIGRYLPVPKDIPEYRRHRRHDDFVTNIPIDPQPFKRDLAAAFGCRQQASLLSSQERSMIAALKARDSVEVRIYPPEH